MDALIDAVFALSPDVRYVAVYHDGALASRKRSGVIAASSAESDRYEELLVNPTLLKLAGQRGDIDCGGLEYIVLRYGHFFQIVRPISGGHISVAVELAVDPIAVATDLTRLISDSKF